MARKSKSTKKNTVPPFTAENLFKAAGKGLNADFAKIRETMPHYMGGQACNPVMF